MNRWRFESMFPAHAGMNVATGLNMFPAHAGMNRYVARTKNVPRPVIEEMFPAHAGMNR